MAKEYLTKEVTETLHELAAILGQPAFILYGGSALDIISGRQISDYDIAFESKDQASLSKLQAKLETQNFRILEAGRRYYIQIDKPVKLLYAEKDQWLLDIAIVPSFQDIGMFSIDSMYIRYPEMEIVDKYEAYQALDRHELALIRSIDNENPYMITARLLSLSAKYDISLTSCTELIGQLRPRLKKWIAPNNFHGPIAYTSAVSSTLKAILRSKDRTLFSHSLLSCGILEEFFPEVVPALHSLINGGSSINDLKDKKDLSRALLHTNIDSKTKAALQKRLESLSIRTWDKNDASVAAKA